MENLSFVEFKLMNNYKNNVKNEEEKDDNLLNNKEKVEILKKNLTIKRNGLEEKFKNNLNQQKKIKEKLKKINSNETSFNYLNSLFKQNQLMIVNIIIFLLK